MYLSQFLFISQYQEKVNTTKDNPLTASRLLLSCSRRRAISLCWSSGFCAVD